MSGGSAGTTSEGEARPVEGVDSSVAHSARVYDFWLGGKDHYAADRAAGLAVLERNPGIVPGVRANRAFLVRTVRFLVGEAGVRQIVDIGTGLPAAHPVHEVAQAIDPATRVLYVDNDPVVMIHAQALLRGEDSATVDYVQADLRDVDRLLAHLEGRFDLTRPVAVMLLMTMQFVPDDDDPYGVVAKLMDALPAGSYLVLSHPARDDEQGIANAATQQYNQRVATPMTRRTEAEIARFFEGLTMVEPGLVPLPDWRSGDDPVPPPAAAEPDAELPSDDARARLERAARSGVAPSPAYCGVAVKE